ncbi:MAG: hypothetical protein IJJ41_02720 [Clostridia bacterium]|nr:hypothetical protein [Clostridia bacterium]
MRIAPLEYENASEEAKKLWDEHEKEHIITNMKRTLLKHPYCFEVMMEWYPLYAEVAAIEGVGELGADIYSYAISSANDCLICETFFRKILMDAGRNPDALDLSEKERILTEYGKACVKQPIKVSDDLYGRMRAHFSEEEMILLTTFAGMMIATNLINHALEVDLDQRLIGYEKGAKKG